MDAEIPTGAAIPPRDPPIRGISMTLTSADDDKSDAVEYTSSSRATVRIVREPRCVSGASEVRLRELAVGGGVRESK